MKFTVLTQALSQVSLSNSMLLLSQTQAKSALALKNVVKLSPSELQRILPSSSDGSDERAATPSLTQKDRLRAAVRGALGSRHPHEADISDSQFLGSAASDAERSDPDTEANTDETKSNDQEKDEKSNHNPVDEM